MKAFSKVLLLSTVTSLVSGVAIAEQPYWTADKLKNAKPLPQPKANFYPSGQQLINTPMAAPGENISASGREPTNNVTPDYKNKLFEPDKTPPALSPDGSLEVTPQSVGGYQAYFSSSRVTPASTSNTSPYRKAGKLFLSDGLYNYVCSASVIRARLVVTAGHCLFNAAKKQWYKNFLFVPAYYNGTAPLKSWTATYWWITPAWRYGGGGVPNTGDFGILEMKDQVINNVTTKIGSVTGYFGYHTGVLYPNHVTMLGYPVSFDSGGWMHRVDSQSYQPYYSNTVIYGSDMTGGSSGGPWIENFGQASSGQTMSPNGTNYVVAVTSYGPIDTSLRFAGASMFDSQFTNSSKTGVLDQACAHKTGNC